MIPDQVYTVLLEAFRVIAIVGGLVLGAGVAGGIILSFAQSFFSINEHSVAYAGRVAGVVLALLLAISLIQYSLTHLYQLGLGG
jgi:flagellar biosynthesis protein FliQ